MTAFIEEQVAIEQHAIRLVRRPDVVAAVSEQAERWRAGTPGFLPETYDQLHASIDEVVLLVALQVADGDPRRPRFVEISAGPHTWGGLDVPGGRWGINNPDTLYFAAPVERGSGYVVRGRPRGGAPTDLNVSVQVPDLWSTIDSVGRADLVFEPDGSFTIDLGDRPAGNGNHLPIGDGGSVLLVRQTLADWAVELPYELTVDRVAGPDAGPALSDDALAQRLIQRLAVVIDHSLQDLQPPVFRLPPNTVPQPGAAGDKPGYLVSQRNTLGHFRLADDEALVLLISPGGAGYAAVAAPNVWGVTTDSARHFNSLNSHQAVLDGDGRITAVVANTDPGVANWVDPGGLREGILMLRWQLLPDEADTNHPLGVTVRPVRLADLHTVEGLTPVTDGPRRLTDRAAAYARRFDAR